MRLTCECVGESIAEAPSPSLGEQQTLHEARLLSRICMEDVDRVAVAIDGSSLWEEAGTSRGFARGPPTLAQQLYIQNSSLQPTLGTGGIDSSGWSDRQEGQGNGNPRSQANPPRRAGGQDR